MGINRIYVICLSLFLFLGIALILRPCTNGQRIYVLNATPQNMYLEIRSDWTHQVAFGGVIHGNKLFKRSIYFSGGQSYDVRVWDEDKQKLLLDTKSYGYIDPPKPLSSFFVLKENANQRLEVIYTEWATDSLWADLFIPLNMCSCIDSYFLGSVPSLY